jgi:Spy/CpxP family protein refolding chaperone
MNSTRRTLLLSLAALGLAGLCSNDVLAQRGGFRGFRGTISHVELATLAEVQSNLKLTDDQKTKAKEIADALASERREMFQQGGGGGNFIARLEQLNKLNTDAAEKLNSALDEAQRKRLEELFVQVNGAGALVETKVAQALALTDDQTNRIRDIMTQSRQAARDAFQNEASADERRAAREKLTAERDEKLLAVLTDEQKQTFEKMKGEKLEVDLSPLRGRRGGGRTT